MSIIRRYICDRCGDEHNRAALLRLTLPQDQPDIDLCRRCETLFMNWMKELPRYEQG